MSKIALNSDFIEGKAYTPNTIIVNQDVPHNKCVKKDDFIINSDQHDGFTFFYITIKNETNKAIDNLTLEFYMEMDNEYGHAKYYCDVPITLPEIEVLGNRESLHCAIRISCRECIADATPVITFKRGNSEDDSTFPHNFSGVVTMNNEVLARFVASYVDNGEGLHFEMESDEISVLMESIYENTIVVTLNENN